MKQKKRMKEGLIPPDPTLTGENTSPLSQNNTDSNGSGDQLKADSPGPQWQWSWGCAGPAPAPAPHTVILASESYTQSRGWQPQYWILKPTKTHQLGRNLVCLGSVSSSPTHEQSAECDTEWCSCGLEMRNQAADTATTELLVPRRGGGGGSTAIHLVRSSRHISGGSHLHSRPAPPSTARARGNYNRAETSRESLRETQNCVVFTAAGAGCRPPSHPPPGRCRQFAAAQPAAATQLLPPLWLTGRKVSMNRTNLISKVIITTRMMRRRYILTHTWLLLNPTVNGNTDNNVKTAKKVPDKEILYLCCFYMLKFNQFKTNYNV